MTNKSKLILITAPSKNVPPGHRNREFADASHRKIRNHQP